VRQAVARDVQYEIKDSERRGLRLVVWPSGAKSFVFRYSFGGVYRKTTLGTFPDMSLADAFAARVKAVDALAAGLDPSAKLIRYAPADDALATFIALYTQHHVSGLREGVQTYIKADLERLQDACPGRALKAITKADVNAVIDAARKRGPSAAVTCWKVLRGFFSWCEGRGDFASPARGIPKPAKEVSRDRVLNDAELVKVWNAADAAGPQFGALVKLLLLTGCRRDEIASLQWSEVTDTAIELPGERTKNGEPHTVTITPAIRAVLDMLPHDGKFVLRRPGHPDRAFSGFSKSKANLKDGLATPWVLHDLRRSFATGLQRLGVLPHIIELCINHRSGALGGIVKVYQRHKHEKEIAAAFHAWSDHVASLLEERRIAA
jgi:integrase